METSVAINMTAYYFAAFCFILLGVSNGKVIDDPLQDDEFDNKFLGERYRRQSSLPPPKCNDWSEWINNNHPANHTNEIEKLSQDELDQICPRNNGNYISDIMYTDTNTELLPKIVNATSGDKTYVYSCMKPIDGASCYLINVNASCPDYSIAFYCTCPTTAEPQVSLAPSAPAATILATTKIAKPTSTDTKPLSTTNKLESVSTVLSSTAAKPTTDSITTSNKQFPPAYTTKQTSSSDGTGGTKSSTGKFKNIENLSGGKSNSLSGGSNSNNYNIGNSSVPWWLIPVLVAAMLFIINVIIAVCLHKKARKHIKQAVHPM